MSHHYNGPPDRFTLQLFTAGLVAGAGLFVLLSWLGGAA